MGENYAVVTASLRRKWAGGSPARYLIDLGAESQPRPFPSTVENATAGRNSRDTRWDRLRSVGDGPRGIGMRSSEDHDPSVSSVPGFVLKRGCVAICPTLQLGHRSCGQFEHPPNGNSSETLFSHARCLSHIAKKNSLLSTYLENRKLYFLNYVHVSASCD